MYINHTVTGSPPLTIIVAVTIRDTRIGESIAFSSNSLETLSLVRRRRNLSRRDCVGGCSFSVVNCFKHGTLADYSRKRISLSQSLPRSLSLSGDCSRRSCGRAAVTLATATARPRLVYATNFQMHRWCSSNSYAVVKSRGLFVSFSLRPAERTRTTDYPRWRPDPLPCYTCAHGSNR